MIKKRWCRKEDLNLRPIAYEATALPTELFRQNLDSDYSIFYANKFY